MASLKSGILLVTAEEDLFTLSPALTTPYIPSIKQEPDQPRFGEELPDHTHKALVQLPFRASQKDLPVFDEVEDPNQRQRSLDPSACDLHQDPVAISALTPRMLEHTVQHTSSSASRSPIFDLVDSPTSTRASPSLAQQAPVPLLSPSGCVVSIHNLPNDICMQDILARIRDGVIQNATLLRLRDAMCAVVTFKRSRSAEQFAHTSSNIDDGTWTFKDIEHGARPRKAQIAYIPTLDTSRLVNNPVSIPAEPRFSVEVDLATRCLAITNCSFELIEGIWKAVCSPFHLRSPHYLNQLDDIWLDGFQRGRGGRIASSTVHIWFTSINMAIGAKWRMANRCWSTNMRFEADPCDKIAPDLPSRPNDDAGFPWHSNPCHSLLDVYRAGHIGELFQNWREISESVTKARSATLKPKEGPKLLPSQEMAARKAAARTNGGFDPVTLMSMSSQDYDSDDEGGRGASRIDTRKIEAQQTANRKPILPSRTACLAALEKLAVRAPSTTIYSPSTFTEGRASENALDEDSEYSDAFISELEDDACDEPIKSSPAQSNQADNLKDLVCSDLEQNQDFSKKRFASLEKALKEPTHWCTVSLAEFLACNEQQRSAMGTIFYVPPEGHNSLEKYPFTKDMRFQPG